MLEIGRINTLKIDTIDETGARLASPEGKILLPARELPRGVRTGDALEVFVLRNAAGGLVATLRKPKLQVGEFGLLKVVEVSKVGAFLDWGLDKDLLVPFSEQPQRMQVGRKYIVRVCLDSLERVVATAHIDRCLETENIDLHEKQEVNLMIWEFTDLGAKVIIDDCYLGLLYQDEIRSGITRGMRLKGYVKQVREDDKIDVTLRRSGREGIEDARETILEALKKSGFLALHDQSPPEMIRGQLGLSKKAFKKGVGGLYKEGRIELTEEGIRLKS